MLRYWLGARVVTLIAAILLTVRITLLISHAPLKDNISLITAVPLALAALLAFLLIEIAASWMIRLAVGEWPSWLQLFERIEVERKARKYNWLVAQISDIRHSLHSIDVESLEGRGELRKEKRALERRHGRLLIQLLEHYPRQDMITPTKLGNTLYAAYQRVDERYGMDVIVVYPRLLALLSKKKRRKAEIANAAMDMWIRLAVTFPMLALLVLISIAPVGGLIKVPYSVTAVIIASLILASVGCYQESIRSAQELGRQIEVIFDLHRIDLLHAINLPAPRTLEEQRELFSILSKILRGDSIHGFTFHYESGDSAAAGKERQEINRIVNQYNIQQAMAVGEKASTRSRNVRFFSGVPKLGYIASANRKKPSQRKDSP